MCHILLLDVVHDLLEDVKGSRRAEKLSFLWEMSAIRLGSQFSPRFSIKSLILGVLFTLHGTGAMHRILILSFLFLPALLLFRLLSEGFFIYDLLASFEILNELFLGSDWSLDPRVLDELLHSHSLLWVVLGHLLKEVFEFI